jgi:hypothetical protein
MEAREEINEAVNQNISYICSEILATEFNLVQNLGSNDKVSVELTDTITTAISIRKTDQGTDDTK